MLAVQGVVMVKGLAGFDLIEKRPQAVFFFEANRSRMR